MEKIIKIDGKEVRFKATAATPLRYKAEFGKDFFNELLRLENLSKAFSNKKKNTETLQGIDFEVFYNMAWMFAKTADSNIKPVLEWLDEFESFPFKEILPQIMELMTSCMMTKKK